MYISILSFLAFVLFPTVSFSTEQFATRSNSSIRLASYNVENLFDAEHDEGKEDWEFLSIQHPLKRLCSHRPSTYRSRCFSTDWTENKFQHKLKQIAKAIHFQTFLPDILALQEMENENVTSQLARELGYNYYVFEEGGDRRGIDVALLYRSEKLDYMGHQSRTIPGLETSRDILAVYFQVKNGKQDSILAVYVNHWPSQASSPARRILAAKGLRKFMQLDRKRFTRSFHGVAMGDFNVIPEDHPHPFHSVLYSKHEDAGEALIDVLKAVPTDIRRGQALGTSFYPPKMSWNHLDRFFVTKNLLNGKGMELIVNSYRILSQGISQIYTYEDNSPVQGSVIHGVPHHFDVNYKLLEKSGYSDHFPIMIDIRI